jgi:hypothetical protein
MAMLLMVTVVGISMSALLVPVIINQDRTTRFVTTRTHSLDAAQAGIDVVLGKIRDSFDRTTKLGDDSQLPCGPVSGNAMSGVNDSYYVEIIYYTKDPVANPSATPMLCSKDNGPFDPNASPPTRTPAYACLISTGVDGGIPTTNPNNTNTDCVTATGAGAYGTGVNSSSKGRTLVTTYVFKTDNTNYAGGVIRIYPNTGNQYCMDAGSATPTNLTPVTLQLCSTSTPPAARQVFAYRNDLSIQLLSSASTTSSGLCLDADTPHANGKALYLATCSAVGAAQPDQQWSINDNSHLEGAKADGSTTDGFCVNVAGQAANLALTLQGCTGGTSDASQTWVPAPTAGAGMAGATNKQEVNFFLFANCLDVTGQNVSASYLILYTCKQNPNPSNVAWNQKFTPNPALGSDTTTPPTAAELVTTAGGLRYCLTSPKTDGGYPTVQTGTTACPTTLPAAGDPARWTVNRALDVGLTSDLAYADKYTIVDSSGLCLGLGGNNDMYLNQYLKIVVTACDGSTGQKWNADPATGKSALKNTRER